MRNAEILTRLEGIYAELMKGDAGAVYTGITGLMADLKEPVEKMVEDAVDKAVAKRRKALEKYIGKMQKKATSKDTRESKKAKYAGCVYIPQGPEKALDNDSTSVLTDGEMLFVTDDDTVGLHEGLDGETISTVHGLYAKFKGLKESIRTETHESVQTPTTAQIKEFKAAWKSLPADSKPNRCLVGVKRPTLFYTIQNGSAYTIDADKLLGVYELLGIKGGEPEVTLHIPRDNRSMACFITIKNCRRWCVVMPIMAIEGHTYYEI